MTRPRTRRFSPGDQPRSRRRPPARRRPVRSAVSAGGVVFRRTDAGVEVLLVGRSREGLWTLPKGTPDPGESIEQTACREVREETGIEVSIVDRVGLLRYRFTDRRGALVHKVVHLFLMEPVGGDVALHDDEFDVVRWCHIAEAEALLTHRNQTPLLHRAHEIIATLPS